MRFWKPFLILFSVIYFPLLIFAVVATPGDKRGAQTPVFAKGLLVIVLPISLGYAGLSYMMDKNKPDARG